MGGGAYINMDSQTMSGGSASNTLTQESIIEHETMLKDLTVYLMQKDGIDMPDSTSGMEKYVKKAVNILNERYDYIGGFPNGSVSLRIPNGLSAQSANITTILNDTVGDLTVDDIFYPRKEGQGDAEYLNEKTAYLARVKSGYGWLSANNGKDAFLVDDIGGVVFMNEEEEMPVMANIMQTAQSKPKAVVTKETVTSLREQRQAAQRQLNEETLAVNRMPDGADKEIARANLEVLKMDIASLDQQINRLGN